MYDKIKSDIAPFDHDHILDPVWVNSRGAIPRFDRGSIEIRIMDIQECPPADLAIQALVIETIKSLVDESFCNLEEQMRVRTEIMAGILDDTAHQGQQAEILSSEFPNIFGLRSPCTAGDLWKHIYARLQAKDASLAHWDKGWQLF